MNMFNYKITNDTMYVQCIEERGYYYSKIFETTGEPIIVPHTPNKLISDNCKLHSQTYIARKEFSKLLTGVSSKLPIILDIFGTHTFFCSHSDRVSYNEWFNLRHIKTYGSHKGMTRVTFSNNEVITIDISQRSFNNQYMNALRLNYLFTLEMNKYKKKKSDVDTQVFSVVEDTEKY